MKKVTFDTPFSIKYPVGDNIQYNLPIIKGMINTLKSIEEYKDREFNFLCRGSSGAIIAGIFATEFPKSMITHIKKEGESSHDCFMLPVGEYIHVIVDDFIETGHTINKIYEEVLEGKGVIHCVCIGGKFKNQLTFTPDYFICKS